MNAFSSSYKLSDSPDFQVDQKADTAIISDHMSMSIQEDQSNQDTESTSKNVENETSSTQQAESGPGSGSPPEDPEDPKDEKDGKSRSSDIKASATLAANMEVASDSIHQISDKAR